MNKADESKTVKNGDQKVIPSPQKIKEIILAALPANDIEIINVVSKETAKKQEFENLLVKNETQLTEKKSEVEKGISNDDVAGLEGALKKQRNLGNEIVDLENFIHEIKFKILPQQETVINNATEKAFTVISSAVLKVKNEYQDEMDSMFVRCSKIKDAFKDAVYLIKGDPQFNKLSIGFETMMSLTEFDTSLAPSSLFNPMAGMNAGILNKAYK